MISEKIQKELNEQINKELYSAYYYLSMAADCEGKGLQGVASFFKLQAQEEVGHAMKIFGYVNEQSGVVTLDAIDKPQPSFKDVEEIFDLAYKHEQYVTKRIHTLVDLALKDSDHATKAFLDWFVTEQVEEEASMSDILQKIQMAGKQGQALLMLDSILGRRGAQNA